MSKAERIFRAVAGVGTGVASWLKVLLRSRKPAKRGNAVGDEIVILANGPSLNDTLRDNMPFLMQRQRLAVNFAANAPQFAQLAPQYYVLADPHFFITGRDANVDRLWLNLAATWPMTLYVPVKYVKHARSRLKDCSNVGIKGYNLTPAEGPEWMVHPLFKAGWAMPRPRNVLIPSIMLALREGFKTIYIAGADHTWTRTLGVDAQNRVVSVQPHFYKDGKEEQVRVNTEYQGYHLHDILGSMTVAFRSYHHIRSYADHQGVKIYNITPDSMIDAFPRLKV